MRSQDEIRQLFLSTDLIDFLWKDKLLPVVGSGEEAGAGRSSL